MCEIKITLWRTSGRQERGGGWKKSGSCLPPGDLAGTHSHAHRDGNITRTQIWKCGRGGCGISVLHYSFGSCVSPLGYCFIDKIICSAVLNFELREDRNTIGMMAGKSAGSIEEEEVTFLQDYVKSVKWNKEQNK